jgi:hypothetical protein
MSATSQAMLNGLLGQTHKARIFKEYHVHCMSPRRNWDSPTSRSRQRVCPPPPGTKGGGAHSPAGEGLGESQSRRLEKHLSTLTILWSNVYMHICRNKQRTRVKRKTTIFAVVIIGSIPNPRWIIYINPLPKRLKKDKVTRAARICGFLCYFCSVINKLSLSVGK